MHPPKFAKWMLKILACRRDGAYLGDVEELFLHRAENRGFDSADRWYRREVLKTIPLFILESIRWRLIMFKYNLKTAVRNLWKFKSLSSINIIGLTVGMAVCILLMLYVQDELIYDRYHQHADRIFRILENNQTYVSPQVSGIVQENFPEIEKSARILVRDQCLVQYQEKRFIEKRFAFADPNLFSIFSFKLKKGDPAGVLNNPMSLVISEAIARKYFGEEEPIGKVLRLENEKDYTVSGVMEEIPRNSHFRYDILATLTDADRIFGAQAMTDWGWRNMVTYLQVQENFSQTSFENKLAPLIAKNRKLAGREDPSVYTLQALKDIHLYSGFISNDIQVQGNISYVLIFFGIGVLILLIACFNYVNLLTAHATKRAKEVGIKKVVGSTRNQLIRQFLGESIFILMIALCLAIGVSYLSLPVFNTLTGKSLSLAVLFSPRMALSILGILVFTGLLSGFYPAFILSSFQPAKTLKSVKSGGHPKMNLGRVIVSGQFAISIILIICALSMARQVRFLRTENLGYDKEQIIVAEIHDTDQSKKYDLLKSALLQNDNVTSVTAASRIPSDDLNNWGGFKLPGQSAWTTLPMAHVDFDYFETFGIPSIQGRFFQSRMGTDRDQAIIFNEAALKKLGLDGDVIGKNLQISWPPSNRRVIGVVKDFHFESLYKPILPVAFVISPPEFGRMAIKVRAAHLNETLGFIEKTWKSYYPDWVFEHQFVDERVNQYYRSEERTFQLMSYFTFLAIFVSCLGLLGLVSYTIKKRLKEISIRKVLGAPVSSIFTLLFSDLLGGILLANLVAWPIAWYALNQWLKNFAYRTSLSLWVFLIAGMGALVVALMTMSWQTLRAARANPIDSLKYE